MGYQEQWKRDIAYRISTILVQYPQGRERFRAKTKEFCEEYQAYLKSQETENPLLVDAEFDALANDEGEQINDVSPQNIPRDPVRGGEYYERPVSDEQVLRERYVALAVLHDAELESDRRIIEEQSLYSRLVSINILQNKREYDKDFYETALVAIEADLKQQTGGVQPAFLNSGNSEMRYIPKRYRHNAQIQEFRDWLKDLPGKLNAILDTPEKESRFTETAQGADDAVIKWAVDYYDLSYILRSEPPDTLTDEQKRLAAFWMLDYLRKPDEADDEFFGLIDPDEDPGTLKRLGMVNPKFPLTLIDRLEAALKTVKASFEEPLGDTGTDWERQEGKSDVCKWIRTEYLKKGKPSKAGVIRAALLRFGLPADYYNRVRKECNERYSKK